MGFRFGDVNEDDATSVSFENRRDPLAKLPGRTVAFESELSDEPETRFDSRPIVAENFIFNEENQPGDHQELDRIPEGI